MKLLGIISISVLLISFSKIDGEIAKIIGIQEYCETGFDDYVNRNIRLIEDGEIIRDSIENKEGKFVIKNLSKGNYKIEFTNIYGQIIQKDISVNKLKSKIKICIEEFNDTGEETFFQKLTTKNILELKFNSWGCSHWEKGKINFFQNDNDLFGELIENGNPSIRKKLSSNDLQYLIIFERKLRQIKNNEWGCTTEDSYHLTMGKEHLKIIDETCDWNGYYKMKKEIFNLEY